MINNIFLFISLSVATYNIIKIVKNRAGKLYKKIIKSFLVILVLNIALVSFSYLAIRLHDLNLFGSINSMIDRTEAAVLTEKVSYLTNQVNNLESKNRIIEYVIAALGLLNGKLLDVIGIYNIRYYYNKVRRKILSKEKIEATFLSGTLDFTRNNKFKIQFDEKNMELFQEKTQIVYRIVTDRILNMKYCFNSEGYIFIVKYISSDCVDEEIKFYVKRTRSNKLTLQEFCKTYLKRYKIKNL